MGMVYMSTLPSFSCWLVTSPLVIFLSSDVFGPAPLGRSLFEDVAALEIGLDPPASTLYLFIESSLFEYSQSAPRLYPDGTALALGTTIIAAETD